jgi:phosphoglycolate phosphatase-like HAD superfamily hydrolase
MSVEFAIMSLIQQAEMLQTVEDFVEDCQLKLELMPGTVEALVWLHAHKILMALVTHNTQRTVNVLVEKCSTSAALAISRCVRSCRSTR